MLCHGEEAMAREYLLQENMENVAIHMKKW